MGGSLRAHLYLAWRAAVIQPLRRVMRTDRRGRDRFLANYAVEGLLPTTAEDSRMLAAASRCISCGLCDRVDIPPPDAGIDDQGPSVMLRQWARSSTELVHVAPALLALDPGRFAVGESICPTRVPIVAIATWLQERARRLQAHQAAMKP